MLAWEAMTIARMQTATGALDTAWLGRQPYGAMWARLRHRAAAIADGDASECIWCCEHDPVYTTGMRGRDNRTVAELPAPLDALDRVPSPAPQVHEHRVQSRTGSWQILLAFVNGGDQHCEQRDCHQRRLVRPGTRTLAYWPVVRPQRIAVGLTSSARPLGAEAKRLRW